MSDERDTPVHTPSLQLVSGSGVRGLMPSNEHAVGVLNARAHALLGAGADDEDAAVERESYVLCRLGARERYGIAYSHVDEVMPARKIASVPGTPAAIAGLVSRRGELLTVLNLRHFFRVEDCPPSDRAAIVVVMGAGLTVGVLVDEVYGEHIIDTRQLTPAFPSEGVADIAHVSGIHDGKITILNMESILGDPAIVVDDGSA